MKAYIIYIATLLAALALPANGQTGNIETKFAPNEPAMPYKFSLATIGGNNGTVKVEDKNGNDGVIFPEKDTLIYGSSSDMTTTYVKLTVTPNKGYIVRKGYPKVYKTGDTSLTIKVNASNDNTYTFKMRPCPITVEMAYANPISKINPITLKEAATATDVVSKLPRYIPITLESGRKDSLAVNNWVFVGKGTETSTDPYDATDGAANRFKATLVAALPDSIADATTPLFSNNTCTVTVVNTAQPLTPTETDKKITISSGNGDNLTGQVEGKGEAPFNGTIESATVKELEVSKDVKDATLTLKDVTVADGNDTGITNIIGDSDPDGGANLTLKIEGTNNLGELIIGMNATVVLDKAEGASLGTTTIENAGTFIDSTATVTKVAGTGALDIQANVDGGGNVTQNASITLTASTNDKAGSTSFIWQKKNTDGSYTEIKTNKYDNNGAPITRADAGITDTYQPATTSVGSTDYRCLIKREITTSGGSSTPPVITLLSTKSETVNVTPKSDPNPDPDPDPSPTIYYDVTLPIVEGAVTDPVAGTYEIESWNTFSFSLTLDKDYDQSKPIVTTSKGETITPRTSDGKYIIKYIYSDLSVNITGIVKNNSTANEDITASTPRVWGSQGYLHVSQPVAGEVAIYTFSGTLFRSVRLPAGDTQVSVPSGSYVVIAGGNSFKVIIQ